MGEREQKGKPRGAPEPGSPPSTSYEAWKRQVEAEARRGLRSGIRGVAAYTRRPGAR